MKEHRVPWASHSTEKIFFSFIRHIREDLCFPRTLRGRQGRAAEPIFRCAKSGSDRLRYGIVLSRVEGTVR